MKIRAAVILGLIGVLLLALLGACAPKATPTPTPTPTVKKEPYIVGLAGYRTGPFGRVGSVLGNGMQDTATLINLKGGIDGWPVKLMEIETAYETPRIVEAYERCKAAGNMVVFHPFSTGGTYAVTPKAFKDKIPIMHTGYGISAAAYGKAFPYNFLATPTYWNIEAASTKFIKEKEGGLEGLKIAIVYIDVDYGRETVPLMKALGKRFGFQVLTYPVPPPALEQSAVWSKIVRVKPDWVILRMWGESTVVAMDEAHRAGFPMKRIIGCPWSPTESDILAGKPSNYIGIKENSFVSSHTKIPIIEEIKEKVIKPGKGYGPKEEVNTQLYNRGVYMMALSKEAIRLAAEKYGHPVNPEQVRWGFEHITPEVIERAGLKGMRPPTTITPENHSGSPAARMHEWNGEELVPVSDWITGYEEEVWGLIEEAAKKFKEENPELYK